LYHHLHRKEAQPSGVFSAMAKKMPDIFRIFEPPCASNMKKSVKQKEAIVRAISAMMGISVMVKIVLRLVFQETKMKKRD
jgi:hypothetical protein